MYDMYAWDQSAREADSAVPVRETSDSRPAAEPEDAVQAVQVAMDRRDNGGPAMVTTAATR